CLMEKVVNLVGRLPEGIRLLVARDTADRRAEVVSGTAAVRRAKEDSFIEQVGEHIAQTPLALIQPGHGDECVAGEDAGSRQLGREVDRFPWAVWLIGHVLQLLEQDVVADEAPDGLLPGR